jgi:hypothetical protein
MLDSVQYVASVLAIRQGDVHGTGLEISIIEEVWCQLSMVTGTCTSRVGRTFNTFWRMLQGDCVLLCSKGQDIVYNKHISEDTICKLLIRCATATDFSPFVLWRLTAGKQLWGSNTPLTQLHERALG